MVCCSIREQLLGLEESSCCSFSNAHFKQSSVKKFIGKERPEFRLFSHLFVLILYILQGRPRTLLENALGNAGIAFGAMDQPSPYLQQLV